MRGMGNMGEMWESVLGLGENEKTCGKVCWDGKGRYRGVGKCNRVWGSVGEVWGV